jgi:hypothetical protein
MEILIENAVSIAFDRSWTKEQFLQLGFAGLAGPADAGGEALGNIF